MLNYYLKLIINKVNCLRLRTGRSYGALQTDFVYIITNITLLRSSAKCPLEANCL